MGNIKTLFLTAFVSTAFGLHSVETFAQSTVSDCRNTALKQLKLNVETVEAVSGKSSENFKAIQQVYQSCALDSKCESKIAAICKGSSSSLCKNKLNYLKSYSQTYQNCSSGTTAKATSQKSQKFSDVKNSKNRPTHASGEKLVDSNVGLDSYDPSKFIGAYNGNGPTNDMAAKSSASGGKSSYASNNQSATGGSTSKTAEQTAQAQKRTHADASQYRSQASSGGSQTANGNTPNLIANTTYSSNKNSHIQSSANGYTIPSESIPVNRNADGKELLYRVPGSAPVEEAERKTSPDLKKDNCKNSVALMLVQSARKTHNFNGASDADVRDFVANDAGMQAQKSELEKKYGCDSDAKKVANLSSIGVIADQAATTASSIAGGLATKNVNETAAEGGNVFSSGYKEMGNATITSGSVQAATGAIEAIYGAKALSIAKRHNEAADDIEGAESDLDVRRYNNSECTESDPAKCKKMSDAQVTARMNGDEYEEDYVSKEADKHRAIANSASTDGGALLMKGIMNAATGGALITQGMAMKKQAEIYDQPITTPVPYDGTMAPIAMNNPTYMAPSVNYNPGSAITAGEDPYLGTDPVQIPPGANAAPTSGGLAGDPYMGDAGMAGFGGTQSGGGGGLGGGGGGSGGGDSGAGEESGDNSQIGGISKYEATGGSGGTGGFASAGDKRRVNDTGQMNFNQLLEKFLGKQEKDPNGAPQGAGFGAVGARAPSSIEDDGSILGPNSNLFARVTNSMLANFKKGNLK